MSGGLLLSVLCFFLNLEQNGDWFKFVDHLSDFGLLGLSEEKETLRFFRCSSVKASLLLMMVLNDDGFTS